ncbi:MAG TPA: hypothetical protein VM366_16980 [Anaerolineae bacterium]|nr:hypothetical protein [Anaerolineae bacterium]
MGILKKLFGRSPQEGRDVLWLYVRCGNCGARVRVRINLHHDLSLTGEDGYIVRKGIVDNECFRPMRAELHFDDRKRVTSRTIEGGEFITAEECSFSQ